MAASFKALTSSKREAKMSETVIHQYNGYCYYTGNSRVIGPMEGIPPMWTDAPFPEIPSGQFAMFVHGGWIITPNPQSDPPIPEPEPVPLLKPKDVMAAAQNGITVL
jgi:hypothetical protein